MNPQYVPAARESWAAAGAAPTDGLELAPGDLPLDHPGQIAAAGTTAREILDRKHAAREVTLSASAATPSDRARRRSVPCTGESSSKRAAFIAEAAAYLAEAEGALAGHADVRHGGFFRRRQEGVRRGATSRWRSSPANRSRPPDELGVDVQPYLRGMAEAASELRRQVLDCLRRDEGAEAERLLAPMDDVYGVLVTIDYPDAPDGRVAPIDRRAAAVLERTRGDVTTAIVAARLQEAIEGRSGTLSGPAGV